MFIKSMIFCTIIAVSMAAGIVGMVVGMIIAFILFLIGVPSSYTNPIGLALEAVLGIAFFIGTFLLLSPITKKLIEFLDRHGWTC
ncbi:hypothetical protein [Dialister succinatiphilus]|uniref:hypothetical protein n=1 Tax=Dialister succinatiphilus TaxID=487173 RepID=UPI004026E483